METPTGIRPPHQATVSERVPDGEYVGRALARRHLAGLTLAETRYLPGAVISSHAHGTPLVAAVLAGSMTEERGRRSLLLEPGSLLYQPPDEPHGHRFHRAGGSCFLIQFGAPWIQKMGDLGVLNPSSPLDLRRSRGNWVLERIREEFHAPDEAASLAIEGLSMVLLGELHRSGVRTREGARPGWLIRVLEILHTSRDHLPPMAEIATQVGVHPVHLSRTFTRFHGCTMGEYVRRLRVERAAAELRTTDRPLSAIALDAGFADQAHFSRVFKRIMGETPARFRNAR